MMKEPLPEIPELIPHESLTSIREGLSLQRLREIHVQDSIEALKYISGV